MDSTFSTLGFVIFGISISFYAFLVQSQMPNGGSGAKLSSPAVTETSHPSAAPSPSPPLLSHPPRPPRSSPLPPLGHRPQLRSPWHHPPQNSNADLRRPSPPPPRHRMNVGKKVGLLFVGVAAIMQVGMVGFLVIKRRQILKNSDRYETCS